MDLPQQLETVLFDPTTGKILAAVIGVLVIYGVRRFVGRTLTNRVADNTARYRTRKLVEFASYVVMALLIATVFNDQLGGFTVAFGVAGAGVAFALQEVIASVAGWMAITFAGFYNIGDRVMLGGVKGDVIDIGVLRTTVFEIGDWVSGDLYNGRVVRLANSFVFKDPVVNYSADFPFLWDEVVVPLRHGSDRTRAQEILEGAVNDITGEYASEVQSTWDRMTRDFVIEHARVQPMVTLVADENWLTYTVRYVTDFKSRRTTKDKLFRRILDALEATDGAVSLASGGQEITLMPPSALDVSLLERKGA